MQAGLVRMVAFIISMYDIEENYENDNILFNCGLLRSEINKWPNEWMNEQLGKRYSMDTRNR